VLVRGEAVVDCPYQPVTSITDRIDLCFVWCVVVMPHQVIFLWYLAHIVFYGSVEGGVEVLLLVAEVLPGGHFA